MQVAPVSWARFLPLRSPSATRLTPSLPRPQAHPARPRRLCQPPWTHTSLSETSPTHRRNQLSRITQAKRQPLFGREGSGGRGASLREAASPPSVSLPLSLEEGARGRGLFYQKSPLPRIHFITTYEFFRCLPWGARSGRGRCPARQRPDRRSGDGGDYRGKRRRRLECAHGSPFRGDGQSWRADPP